MPSSCLTIQKRKSFRFRLVRKASFQYNGIASSAIWKTISATDRHLSRLPYLLKRHIVLYRRISNIWTLKSMHEHIRFMARQTCTRGQFHYPLCAKSLCQYWPIYHRRVNHLCKDKYATSENDKFKLGSMYEPHANIQYVVQKFRTY